jgi:hypothetical protein
LFGRVSGIHEETAAALAGTVLMCLEMKAVEKQGMSEDKKHTYVLFVDLTFACFSRHIVTRPMTESWDLDTRRFATSCYPVACTSAFLFLPVLFICIISGFRSAYK